MERGAGTASLAISDNAVLFFHKAVLFRAFFENSIMTHVQSASMDKCAPPGLFSPWLIFHPPQPPQPQSVPHAHYFTRRNMQCCPTQFLSVCPCSSQKSPVLLGQLLSMDFAAALKAAGMTGLTHPSSTPCTSVNHTSQCSWWHKIMAQCTLLFQKVFYSSAQQPRTLVQGSKEALGY